MIRRTTMVCPLTIEMAKDFARMKSAPLDRRFDPGRVEALRRQADMGLLVTFRWAYAVCGTEHFRLNGQHSSIMLATLAEEGTFPVDLRVHLRKYHVDSMNELLVLRRWMKSKHHAFPVACGISFVLGWAIRSLM